MMQMFSGASSGGWFEKAQRFGKSFMLPIAVLPAAGLLLGIGGALSNAYFHERRSLNNFHRDRVITFEQIAE
ncbi:hypothetical protein KZB14_25280 [Escherichia coli]|uniref:hypothetical protein n=1 Tax=Escherichia coli TaxID=562 RepID=UPI001C6ED193|nr:hypothetical protein [Escherichia coli]MBW8986347.1 hypothetical protein [Escherichia coli]